jgi:hypothetical protein
LLNLKYKNIAKIINDIIISLSIEFTFNKEKNFTLN